MPTKPLTQVPVTKDDLLHWTIAYDPETDEATCAVTYRIRDSTGAQLGTHKGLTIPLTQNEQAQLNGFTHATVLRELNRFEGT